MFPEELKTKQKTLDYRKKQLKRSATKGELIIKGILIILRKERKIGRHIFQKGLISGNGYCICDFYIPQFGLCIEVDGGYHFTKSQQSYDSWKNNYIINERKMRVFRINEIECYDLTTDALLAYIIKSKRHKLLYSDNYYKVII